MAEFLLWRGDDLLLLFIASVPLPCFHRAIFDCFCYSSLVTEQSSIASVARRTRYEIPNKHKNKLRLLFRPLHLSVLFPRHCFLSFVTEQSLIASVARRARYEIPNKHKNKLRLLLCLFGISCLDFTFHEK